jgi:hypothetical protein
MLNPRPARDYGIQHKLRAALDGDIGWRQVYCQEPSVCIDCDMPFASADFLCAS